MQRGDHACHVKTCAAMPSVQHRASSSRVPSICATLYHLSCPQVVGSMDASATRYAARVSMQAGRQEIVADLKNVRRGLGEEEGWGKARSRPAT